MSRRRAREKRVSEAVIDEAQNGFDLGVDRVMGDKSGFEEGIESLTEGFEGPLSNPCGEITSPQSEADQ
jgi:hypothetical protein